MLGCDSSVGIDSLNSSAGSMQGYRNSSPSQGARGRMIHLVHSIVHSIVLLWLMSRDAGAMPDDVSDALDSQICSLAECAEAATNQTVLYIRAHDGRCLEVETVREQPRQELATALRAEYLTSTCTQYVPLE